MKEQEKINKEFQMCISNLDIKGCINSYESSMEPYAKPEMAIEIEGRHIGIPEIERLIELMDLQQLYKVTISVFWKTLGN